jgi:hypothetical protein
MFRAIRVAIAVAMACGALAASAAATVSPTGAATLTATSALRFGSMTCSGGGGTATIVNASVVTTNLQLTFTCSGYTVACAATGKLAATGLTVSGITPFVFQLISCTVRSTSLPCTSTITGSVLALFNNATSALAISSSGQALAYRAGSTCPGMTSGTPSFSASPSGLATYTFSPATTITF